MRRLPIRPVHFTVLIALGSAALTGPASVALAQTPSRPAQAEPHGWFARGAEIGVAIRDVTDEVATRERLDRVSGALVSDVRAGSPAARAGLQSGDVIIAFDGERVRSARHLERLINETPAGRQVDATVSRSGQQVTLQVTPAAAPSMFASAGRLLPPDFDLRAFGAPGRELWGFGANAGRLGARVQNLDGQLGEYFGTDAGVLVTAVDTNTPAAAAGLRAGDVITKVNGTSIDNPNDLRRAVADASREITLTIVRDRKALTLTATLGDAPRPRVRTTI
jgi:serine protease Do